MMINEIIPIIKEAQTIALFPHINADGDAIGATLGLYHALKKNCKKVSVYVEEEPMFVFEFLNGIGEVCVYKGDGKNHLPQEFDLSIAIDTADVDRMGKRYELFNKAKMTINIDHHPTNTNYANHNYVDSSAAAAGEIIFDLVEQMDGGMDDVIATCIYTAISFDTGGFRYANTSTQTHLIASKLIGYGARAAEISINLYENISLQRLKIMGELSNALELHGNGKIALIYIPKEVVDRTGASEEDLDGLSNIGRSIRGVEVAVSIRSKGGNHYKVSMRSRNKVDLSPVALKHGGGGHKRAAGFDYIGEIETIKELLLKEFLKVV